MRALRSELISSNIANIDTPDYKSVDLKFEHILEQAGNSLKLKVTNPKHISETGAADINNEIVKNPETGRADGNNVNIDSEMLKLTKNNIQYNIAVQLISKSFLKIKEAMRERT